MLKKIQPTLILIALALILASCNDSPKKQQTKPTEKTEATKPESPSKLYVIAPSGLILRERANLDSKRIDKLPYGSAVKVISDQTDNSLEVANIPGSMLNVKYKDTSGYAYSGYLVKFPTPKRGENANQYGQRLKSDYPEVGFKTENKKNENDASTQLILTLPTQNWSEAFLIAKQLYDIPAEFEFPRINGPSQSTFKGSSSRKNITATSLTAKRTDDSLYEIEYSEAGKSFERLVKIIKNDSVFELTEEVTDH